MGYSTCLQLNDLEQIRTGYFFDFVIKSALQRYPLAEVRAAVVTGLRASVSHMPDYMDIIKNRRTEIADSLSRGEAVTCFAVQIPIE